MRKKIIFVICTIFILCFGSISCAATNLKDIKNTKYEDSVNTLVTLGLVNGYEQEDGSYLYKPDKVVTRAEMAKLMVVALGEDSKVSEANNKATKFNDMNGHWSYGYVNLAAELGIINGYPDGRFAPNNTVSYAEATAMILRALEYESEVAKSTEVWPNNYISQAKKLSLYESVGTITASEGAQRGNLGILLWNMLRTGVCEPIGQNAAGVIYGEGEKMLNKKIKNFVYLENAKVSDIEFDDYYEKAEIKIKGDQTIKVTYDAVEAAKMYGQTYNVLYNTSSEKIVKIEKTSSDNVKEGEITELTSSKIYVKGGSSKGYSLPTNDDNIILCGIDSLDEAVTAIVVLDGTKTKYVIGFPPAKMYLGLVTDNNVTVSDDEGIKVANFKTSTAKSYALADDDDIPNEDSVILYYLNGDGKLVILDKASVFGSHPVQTVTTSSNKIKFNNKSYTLKSGQDTLVKYTATSLKDMKLSNVNEDVDSAVIVEFGAERYFIIFVGGLEKAEEDLASDVTKAITTLSTYMNKSATKNVLSNEIKYTQSTYATFVNKYQAAETAIANAQNTASSANLDKLNIAYTDLQTAYKNLKLITSLSTSSQATEKEKVELKIALRKIVDGTEAVNGKKVPMCVTNKDTYTTASFNTFNTALSAAKTQLSKTNATSANLTKVTNDLKAAMDALVEKEDDAARVEALAKLTEALEAAKTIGKTNSGKYTADSFAIFLDYYNAAEAVKTSLDATAITSAAEDLNRAIRTLSETKDEALADLNKKIDEALAYENKGEDYFEDEYEAFVEALEAARNEKLSSTATNSSLKEKCDALDEAIRNLKDAKIDDVLKALKEEAKDKYTLQSILDLTENDEEDKEDKLAKIDDLKIAMKKEDADIEIAKIKLDSAIKIAKRVSKEEWPERYEGSYDDMAAKLAIAETEFEKTKTSSEKLNEVCEALEATMVEKTN